MSSLIHHTLTPSITFKGTKIDLNFQKFVPFGSYAALYYAERVDNKYQSHTNNGILFNLTDDTTSNMTAWIPGGNNVVIINKYTIKVTSYFRKQQYYPLLNWTSSTYRLVFKRVLS